MVNPTVIGHRIFIEHASNMVLMSTARRFGTSWLKLTTCKPFPSFQHMKRNVTDCMYVCTVYTCMLAVVT